MRSKQPGSAAVPPYPTEFSPAQLGRMQRTLRRRFGVGRAKYLVEVGFGAALAGGRVDAGRGLVASFLVTRKGRPRRGAIPAEVTLRVRDDRSWKTVTLRTDVVEVGSVVPSGSTLVPAAGDPATAGAVVIWQERRDGGVGHYCGLVTVGHAFATQARELVLIEPAAAGSAFNGRLYAKSRRPSPVDAALVHVNPDDLVESEILESDMVRRGIVDPDAVVAIAPKTVSELLSVPGPRGLLLRSDRPMALALHVYLPTMMIPTLGRLQEVVSGWARRPNTFSPGTSGAIWEVDEEPVATQVASTPEAFRQGFGQALERVLLWVQTALRRTGRFVPGSLQLVSYF